MLAWPFTFWLVSESGLFSRRRRKPTPTFLTVTDFQIYLALLALLCRVCILEDARLAHPQSQKICTAVSQPSKVSRWAVNC